MQDGLHILKAHLDVRTIAGLIEKTARWVDPETFRLLPVWFPEFARRAPLYNAGWSKRQQNTNKASGEITDKIEGNTQANTALCQALGIAQKDRPNWSCCHIWGVDDAAFVKANSVVQDHRFFSCVANMVLLPSPLKAFTDVMPEIKAMLRRCSADLYGWACDHPDLAPLTGRDFHPGDYPAGWHTAAAGQVPGIVPISAKVRANAAKRKATIARDLVHAGEFYPRDKVRDALGYWKREL
jgi:hypothetical protein